MILVSGVHFFCWQELVPSYLATSPIMSTGEGLMQTQLSRNASRHHGRLSSKNTALLFNRHLMWSLQKHTHRAHSLQLASCPECRDAAWWWWDEQKEEKKEEESPSRDSRREERREWRGVLRRWGHVYHRHELRGGGIKWWQQVCVRVCVCLCVLQTRVGSGSMFCLRTAASLKFKLCLWFDFIQLQKLWSDCAGCDWLKSRSGCWTLSKNMPCSHSVCSAPSCSWCSAPSIT